MKVLPGCKGCVRVREDNTCSGWAEPLYNCPHYTDDIRVLEKTERDIRDYEWYKRKHAEVAR